MADQHERHRACVSIWMGQASKASSSLELLALFERAMSALWQRTGATLGEVTLRAIADRVLYTAAERFPVLTHIELRSTGLDFEELREKVGTLNREDLARGFHFALLEFLTVLGHLTAEILTPALHEELVRVATEAAVSVGLEPGEGDYDKRRLLKE